MIPRVTLLDTRKQKRGSRGHDHSSPFDTLMGRAGGETPTLMYYFPRPLRGGEDSPLCAVADTSWRRLSDGDYTKIIHKCQARFEAMIL